MMEPPFLQTSLLLAPRLLCETQKFGISHAVHASIGHADHASVGHAVDASIGNVVHTLDSRTIWASITIVLVQWRPFHPSTVVNGFGRLAF